MEQSMQAKTNGVAFKPTTFNGWEVLRKAFMNFVGFWESVGRARAANQLYNMGYHEQAKELILGKTIKERG